MYDLLHGVRVVDLTTVVLGPYATKLIADLGADVVKVEPLSGDQYRFVRPGRSPEMGGGFLNLNINKRSIAIDLSKTEGRDLLASLVTRADVLVHNMRPKSAAKFGITYEKARVLKPDIVYCYAPGFGQDATYRDEPAYDDTIQAASGIAALNRDRNGEPRFVPTIIADKVGGLHLATAIAAGIAARARTGSGCCIEVPMFESAVSFLMLEQLSGESFVPAIGGIGYERLLSPNRRPFATADGFISILPYTTKHWQRFLCTVGRCDMAELDWVVDPGKRSEKIDLLYQVIAETTPSRSTKAWIDLLRSLDIPCSRVNRPIDLLSDDHLVEAKYFREYDHPTEGRLRSIRSPFRVLDSEQNDDTPASSIGADTESVLGELGYTAQNVRELASRGVIRRPPDSCVAHEGVEP